MLNTGKVYARKSYYSNYENFFVFQFHKVFMLRVSNFAVDNPSWDKNILKEKAILKGYSCSFERYYKILSLKTFSLSQNGRLVINILQQEVI